MMGRGRMGAVAGDARLGGGPLFRRGALFFFALSLLGCPLWARSAAADDEFVLFQAAPCVTPPCTSRKVGAVGGHKTTSLTVVGTGTVSILCRTSSAVTAVTLATQTGAGSRQDEFDTACLELYATVTACTGGCTTTAAVVVAH